MKSQKFLIPLFPLFFLAIFNQMFSQQQVEASSLERSYKGGFFRVDVGITPGNITYGEDLDGNNIVPLYFDFVGGKRINRSIAPYFLAYGHVLVKETVDLLNFAQSGMSIGSNFYYRNPNTYIAPEVGLAILTLEMNGGNSYTDNMGVKLAIKSGWDFHITGKMFFGTQLYISYFTAKNREDEFLKGSGFFYGVNISLKYGK